MLYETYLIYYRAIVSMVYEPFVLVVDWHLVTVDLERVLVMLLRRVQSELFRHECSNKAMRLIDRQHLSSTDDDSVLRDESLM